MFTQDRIITSTPDPLSEDHPQVFLRVDECSDSADEVYTETLPDDYVIIHGDKRKSSYLTPQEYERFRNYGYALHGGGLFSVLDRNAPGTIWYFGLAHEKLVRQYMPSLSDMEDYVHSVHEAKHMGWA